MDVRTIDRNELKAKLERGDQFRLVMALNEFAFNAQHIPGSEHFPTVAAAFAALAEDEEIVVYCSDPACVASLYAYQGLVDTGYRNVRRYSGGLSDWQAAGLPSKGAQRGELGGRRPPHDHRQSIPQDHPATALNPLGHGATLAA
jgi:rhodanese-related sulfurtransferase